jgi:hypothetical protein
MNIFISSKTFKHSIQCTRSHVLDPMLRSHLLHFLHVALGVGGGGRVPIAAKDLTIYLYLELKPFIFKTCLESIKDHYHYIVLYVMPFLTL